MEPLIIILGVLALRALLPRETFNNITNLFSNY